MIYYNLADQGFKSSNRASVGIFNVSIQLGVHLSEALPCTFLLTPGAEVNDELDKSAKTLIVKGGSNGLRRIVWDQWGLFSALETNKSDWLFMPKGFSSFIKKPPCQLAGYIHDIVYAYWRSVYKGYRSPLLHTYYDWGLKASLRNADVLFVNTDFTAGELQRFAAKQGVQKLPPIVTAGIGFDHLLSAPCEAERQGILVYVSAWPHKCSATLLAMMERWQIETGFSEPVYLLGTLPKYVRYSSFPNWAFLETLPEQEYRALLGRVRCSIFNSEYEGFGMPPAESVMQGAIPIYSSIPALNEVMNGIGFPYCNEDFDSFGHALDSALSAQRDRLVGWKKRILNTHNWSRVTRIIKQVIG